MLKFIVEVEMLAWYQSTNSFPAATSGARGFSARTCLPAERAALMKEDWTWMGRAMMTAWMSERERRDPYVLEVSSLYRSTESLRSDETACADFWERE